MALRRRDDFTKKTVELLARRAGGKCSMCQCSTWGPNDRPYSATNIGQAAHIAAAAPGGPRYDATMSPEDRSSISNGIWLCSNCHSKVDSNVVTYTTERLKKLKYEAESRAKKELGVAKPTPHIREGMIESCVSAAAIIEIRKARSVLATMHGQTVGWDEAKQVIEAIDFIKILEDRGYLPQVGEELYLFGQLLAYSHESVVQLEAIRHVKEIVDAYYEVWKEEEVRVMCEMMHDIAKQQSTPNKVYQSAMALVKHIAQLTGQKDNGISKIPKEVLQLMRKSCLNRRRVHPIAKGASIEEVDYGDISESTNNTSRGEETAEWYLQKMEELAGLTTTNNDTPENLVEQRLKIEQEIRDCGYEPDIL